MLQVRETVIRSKTWTESCPISLKALPFAPNISAASCGLRNSCARAPIMPRASIAAAALHETENAAIKDFSRFRQRLGFRSVTDGEFRRSTYTSNFTTEGISGVTADHIGEDAWSYTDASGHRERARIPSVEGRIAWNNSANARDFADLAALTPAGLTPKITLPGPCYIHFRAGRERISRDVYPDSQMFW